MYKDIESMRNLDKFFSAAIPTNLAQWTSTPRGKIIRYTHPIVGDSRDELTKSCGLPITVVTGNTDGPTLLLIAGEHGNEYENIVALQETLKNLDPKQIKGRVVGVNCCSVDSYLNDMRVGHNDGLNLARCYPGRPDGTLTERVAYTLQKDFISQPSPHRPVCLVPLHTFGPGLLGATLSGYNIYPKAPDLTQKQREISIASGLPLIWGHEFDASLAATTPFGDDANGRTALYGAYLAGIPAVYWETTWGAGGEEDYKRALVRLMIYLGLLDGKLKPVAARAQIESTEHGAGNMASHHPAPSSGLWRPLVKVWDKVKTDEPLGILRNLNGEDIECVRSLKDGTVISIRRIQRIDTGTACSIVL